MQVTAEDLIESEEVFGELGRLASSLPEGLLMNFVRQQKWVGKIWKEGDVTIELFDSNSFLLLDNVM